MKSTAAILSNLKVASLEGQNKNKITLNLKKIYDESKADNTFFWSSSLNFAVR